MNSYSMGLDYFHLWRKIKNKMTETKFELPGAPNFSRWLEEKVQGVLTVECPEINGRKKMWTVKFNNDKIGEYVVIEDVPGKKDYTFNGVIPGYVNPSIKREKPIQIQKKKPVGLVWLGYFNSGYFDDSERRRDLHSQIPFP